MKIVHICLNGPVTDGWSYQDNLLSKYHCKAGHEVDLIASQYVWDSHGKMVLLDKNDYLNDDGVHIIRLPNRFGTTVKSKVRLYSGLYEQLVKSEPDVLFVHGAQFVGISTIVKYLEKNPQVKVYVDNHADFSNSAANWLSKNILHKVIWRHYAKKIEPYVTKFYGVLPARVDFLRDVYSIPADKIELLVMGADDELVKAAEEAEIRKKLRKAYGLEDDDFVVLTGGKIDHNKPQTVLLMKAINALPNSKIKLLVFGNVIPELREVFEGQLSDRVRYIGWKNSGDIYAEFAAADLIAFPGLHSVLWEQAVGMGKPCAFRRILGFDHVDLDGNCTYFEEDSLESYGKTIMAAQAEIDNLREVALQKGKNAFSYMRIAKKSLGE